MWAIQNANFTTHFSGDGKFIPPIKMVIFLGDGKQGSQFYLHVLPWSPTYKWRYSQSVGPWEYTAKSMAISGS